MKRKWSIYMLSALFLCSPILSLRLNPLSYRGGRSRSEQDRVERNTSAAAIMLGELRTAFNDMLYIKSERYMHNGTAYMLHLADQLMSVAGSSKALERHESEVGNTNHHHHAHHPHADDHGHDAHETHDEHDRHEHAHHQHGEHGEGVVLDHDCTGTPTIIPTQQNDYRGFIGQLHRKVKPWRDPSKGHLHTTGTELLPWFKLMTLSDPHYVRAYAIGGWWLKRKNEEAAFEFVNEGIEHNPDAFQIYITKAGFLLDRWRDEGKKRDSPIFNDLKDCYIKAARAAIEQRPQGWTMEKEDISWTIYMEEDALYATRMAVLLDHYYGDKQAALQRVNKYLKIFPDDKRLQFHQEHLMRGVAEP